MISKTWFIAIALIVAMAALAYYVNLPPTPNDVELKGNEETLAWVSLATAIVGLLTAIVGLFAKLKGDK